MGTVTILTPLFNGIEYFEECYTGILKQTHREWLWIIGINGHKDDIIYHKLYHMIKDPRILVKKYETVGKVATLNAMVQDVDTTYIALCDVDDIWFPQKLQIQKMFLDEHPIVDVFAAGCQYIGEHSGSPDIPHGLIDLTTLFKINPVINSSVIMKRQCAIWEDRFAGLDDYDMWFRLLIEKKLIFTIGDPLIYHRIHGESAFNSSGVQDIGALLSYYRKKICDVTVVSAYYPIKSKYPIENYLTWMEVWRELPCNLVFFTTPELVSTFTGLRTLHTNTKIVGVPFSELVAFQRYTSDFWLSECKKDHEKHNAELYAIWYEKKEFVLKAIELDVFNTSKFVWCDAGICRSKTWIRGIQSFPRSDLIVEGKFTVLRITDFEKYHDFQDINCVGGGILCASKEIWTLYSKKYDTMLKEYIDAGKFVGKDQSIIASMIKKEPDFFHIVPRMPIDDISCWFSLLFLLS